MFGKGYHLDVEPRVQWQRGNSLMELSRIVGRPDSPVLPPPGYAPQPLDDPISAKFTCSSGFSFDEAVLPSRVSVGRPEDFDMYQEFGHATSMVFDVWEE